MTTQVVKISPRAVPTVGGSWVHLTILSGKDWSSSAGALSCVFDNIYVSAVVEGSVVSCQAPPHPAGIMYMDVVPEGAPNGTMVNTSPRFPFKYYPPPVLHTAQPASASETGGKQVFISGTGFLGGSLSLPQMLSSGSSVQSETTATATAYIPLHVICQFMGANVATTVATVYSDTLLSCMTPTFMPQRAALAVSLNGIDYNTPDRSLAFTFTPQITVAKVSPSIITTRGRVNVTLFGTSFDSFYQSNPAQSAACVFNGVQQPVLQFISSTQLICEAPAQPAGNVTVSLSASSPSSSVDRHPALEATLTYITAPVITSASPLSGPMQGETIVTLRGIGVLAIVACRIGRIVVPIVPCETCAQDGVESVQCVTPPVSSPSVNALSVSVNGVDFIDTTLPFSYSDDQVPSVLGLSPLFGPDSGGSQLVVTVQTGVSAGANMTLPVERSLFQCEIGSHQVPAIVLPNIQGDGQGVQRWLCITPGSPPGLALVRVTMNGQQYGSSSNFEFFPTESIAQVVSSQGQGQGLGQGTVTAGSVVSVVGQGYRVIPSSNLSNLSSLSCRFKDMVVSATFVNTTMVQCTVPAGLYGTISVSVANNGQDFTPSMSQVYVLDPSTFWTMAPKIGPTSGGYNVTITMETPVLVGGVVECMFGSTIVLARTTIQRLTYTCQVPPLPTNTTASQGALTVDERLVTVQIRINGQRLASPGQFFYTPVVAITAFTPLFGPEDGGWPIRMNVAKETGYQSNLQLSCRFAGLDAMVTATTVHRGQATCMVPPGLNIGANPVELLYSSSPLGVGLIMAMPAGSIVLHTKIVMTEIQPAFGSAWTTEQTHTVVKITGNGLQTQPWLPLCCEFDGLLQRVVQNTGTDVAICNAPSHAPGRVYVRVVVCDAYVPYPLARADPSSHNFFAYEYVRGEHVASFYPTSGYSSGETTVTIVGMGFLLSSRYTCVFFGVQPTTAQTDNGTITAMSITTPATVISSTVLTCRTASVPMGLEQHKLRGEDFRAPFALTVNGTTSLLNASFHWLPLPVFYSSSPSLGVTTGGYKVTLLSHMNLSAYYRPTCRFGSEITSAASVVTLSQRSSGNGVTGTAGLPVTGFLCEGVPSSVPSTIEIFVSPNGQVNMHYTIPLSRAYPPSFDDPTLPFIALPTLSPNPYISLPLSHTNTTYRTTYLPVNTSPIYPRHQ